MPSPFIFPDWPAPRSIFALSTTRVDGFSRPPYDELNLGHHVGDEPDLVERNRNYLQKSAQLPEAPRWLNQVHGTQVSFASGWQYNDEADAIISDQEKQVCAIMTADCLPLLLCNKQGNKVAAIHAGWRGLANGIIEKTVQDFSCLSNDILVWLGPAIGPNKFEVGSDVFEQFTAQSPLAAHAFQQVDSTHYLANIYLLARQRLNAIGVNAIFGGEHCTFSDPEQFFSYRRDGVTGRMASMIWIDHK